MKLRRTNKKNNSDSEQSSDSSEHSSLKKDNSSKTDSVDNSTKINKRPGSPIEDDSLADFKLPKLNSRSSLARNGVKLLDNPKKSTKTKSNPSKTSKQKLESNQMSIESSFFKPPTAFVCPLCLKSFNESSQQIAHSKNCAAKNKISTRQLIAATELHERQAEERKAIGLPAAPIQQPQAKKTSKFKRMSTSYDPDIELAMALSESLSEAQEIEDLEEAVVLAAESNEKVLEMSSSQRKSTLVNFGFITNKPIALDFNDKPKKKKMGPTILQTRTEEVRSRLLAERIAEAIIDNVIATQRPISPDSIYKEHENEKINFKSIFLREIYRPDCKLWNGSVGEENVEFYYIESLHKFFRPIKDINDLKSKNELYTNRNEDDQENRIESINQSDCMSPTHENVNKMFDIKKKQDSIVNLSKSNENLIENEQKIENNSKISDDREIGNEIRFKQDRLRGLNPVALSWSKMINSKILSDVIIHVKYEKFIFSHFLVLSTRCHEIEKDIIVNNTNNNHGNNESEHNTEFSETKPQWAIMWEDIEYQAGILFLEFIYCGLIMNVEALKDELILNSVKSLTEKYKLDELNTFLDEFTDSSNNLNRECRIIDNNQEKNEEQLYAKQNKSGNEEFSNFDKLENQNFSTEDKVESSTTNENLNTDFQVKSLEYFAHIIDDNDTNIQEKDGKSVNKINANESSIKTREETVIIISEDELELSQISKSATKTNKNELLRASFMSVSPDIFDGMETMNLGNSFGKKLQNTRGSDNSNVENYLKNDYTLPFSTEYYDENKRKIEKHEKITVKKSFQNDEEKYLDKFTRTVEEDSEKEELNVEKNCSQSEKVFETTNQLTEKNDEYVTSSKSISKTRNNLSLFIQKIQRRNARFLESDTDEDDSVVIKPSKKKNPFKIGRRSENDSGLLNILCRRDLVNQEEESLESDQKVEKKSALSIFEDDVRNRVAIESKKRADNEIILLEGHNQNDVLEEKFSERNSDIEFGEEDWRDIINSEMDLKDDLQEGKEGNELKMDQTSTETFDNNLANESCVQSEEADSDEANESMYTKYKKTHRRNSIDKYRAAIKTYFNNKLIKDRSTLTTEENNSENNEDSSEYVENSEESEESCSEKSSKMTESPVKETTNQLLRNKRISLINQKNLTELSSFDFYEIEDIPEGGRVEDDAHSTYNSQEVMSHSIDLTFTSDDEKSIDPSEKLNQTTLSVKKSSNTNNLIEDCEIHDENFKSIDWNETVEVKYPLSQNVSINKNIEQPDDNDFSLIVKSNWEPHSPKVDWKKERSENDSFTQFTGTPTVTENVTKLLQECGILSSSYQNKDNPRLSIADILSPIVLSSATDSDGENGIDDLPDNLFLDFDGDNEQNVTGNYSQNNAEMNFTRFEYEGGANTDFAEISNFRFSTHLPITSSTQYLKTPPVSSRSSQVPNRLTYDISSDEDEKLSEEVKSSQSRRCSSISPLKNKSHQRLLQVKSRSEGNFSSSRKSLEAVPSNEKTKCAKRKQNYRKNEIVCQFLGLSPSKVDISYDVSPKESYDQMSSPELKKRLASFGLKNQERHRAVKLLNFMWDQMHPLVPTDLIPNNASSTDSKADNKNMKRSLHNNLQQINEQDSSEDDSKDEEVNRLNRTSFPEEFEFSDNSDNNDNDNDNNDNNYLKRKLHQNFEKLLEKDSILHRKILMYEPISLDIFAEKLKESGFLVKPKILADFLNSECISFFIETPKKWSGNIKKNRKK